MPKLDATHIAERLRSRLADLEAGKEVAAKEIRALLSPDQIAVMDEAWAEQQKLRKVGRPRTEEEQRQLGWKTKREIYIDAYRQAIAASEANLVDDFVELQRKAEIIQARIYFDTYSQAVDEGRDKEQAKSIANNALTRARLRRMDFSGNKLKNK